MLHPRASATIYCVCAAETAALRNPLCTVSSHWFLAGTTVGAVVCVACVGHVRAACLPRIKRPAGRKSTTNNNKKWWGYRFWWKSLFEVNRRLCAALLFTAAAHGLLVDVTVSAVVCVLWVTKRDVARSVSLPQTKTIFVIIVGKISFSKYVHFNLLVYILYIVSVSGSLGDDRIKFYRHL